MVGTFLEPSCGRRHTPIHSIPYSVAQPLERGSNNYYSIIQGCVLQTAAATTALSKVVNAEMLSGVMDEIIGLLPVVLPVMIGFIALRKGIGFVTGMLHSA